MKLAYLASIVSAACVAVYGQTPAQTGLAESAGVKDAIPQLPRPTGRFGIGRVGYDWTDAARPDRYSADPKARREIMVYFWYPTSPGSEATRGPYIAGAQQMNAMPEIQSRMQRALGANWPLIVSGAIFSHAAEGAAAAKTPKQFPLVVFSHGAGNTSFNYSALLEDLASHGYVVAAIEHTYAARVVWFPDGRAVPMRPDLVTIDEGAGDARFVLGRLTEINARDTQHFHLAGRLDLSQVAAMGHSAGAEYTARACQLDARFRACVDLDGGMVPVAALPVDPDGATMKQPLLFLEAYHPESQMGGTKEQHEEYFRKKEEQLQSCRPGSYDVELHSEGIAHPSFSDIPLLLAGQKEFPATAVVLHNLDLIETFVRAFLGKNLRQEKAPLFDGHAPHPEATVKPYGH